MVQPINQADIIGAGMNLVPNYAAQQAQQQQMELQRSQQQLTQQSLMQKQQEAQREFDEETNYTNDMAAAIRTGNPQDIINLSLKYPKKSEGIKRSWDMQEKAARESDLRQAVSILGYVSNGKPDLAAQSLRDRMAKAREAGEADDPQDTAILAALESGDPAQIAEAKGLISYQVASITGAENFSKTLGDLNPESKKTPLEKEVEYLRSIGRDDLAEAKLTEQGLLTVQGAGVYNISDFARGGGPTSSGGGGLVATPEQRAESERAAAAMPNAPKFANDVYSITEQIESGGNPNAVSPKGARGPMQTMPGTLRDPGFGIAPARNDSVQEQRRVGRDYIDAMRGKYGGDMAKAWAAYNWGPDNLNKAIAKHGNGWLSKAPAETRNYVRKALTMLNKADKASAPVKVTSIQQANSLPPGTLYMRPDGKVMQR